MGYNFIWKDKCGDDTMPKKMIKPKGMAERLDVTVLTLQRWDKKGILKAYRTPTNGAKQRWY